MIRLDAVTLKQLRALAAISEHGSITAAAEALGLTPPAVHAQIKSLEAMVPEPVLQRVTDSAGSRLTGAGEVLRDGIERIETILRRCGQDLHALSSGQAGRVTLGISSTGKYFAPQLFKELRRLCDDVDIMLRIDHSVALQREMEQQAVDLAILSHPPQDGMSCAPLGPHPYGLVAAPDHPLATGAAVTAASLQGQTFVARERGSATRMLMDQFLHRLGDEIVIERIEMPLNEAIKQAVMAGIGIAFLSLHTVSEEIRSGRIALLPARDLPVLRDWHLFWPEDRALKPVAAHLRDAIISLHGAFLPQYDVGRPIN